MKARRRDPYGEPQAYALRFVLAGRPRPTSMTVPPKPVPPPEPEQLAIGFPHPPAARKRTTQQLYIEAMGAK
jgi:hypothetical protein